MVWSLALALGLGACSAGEAGAPSEGGNGGGGGSPPDLATTCEAPLAPCASDPTGDWSVLGRCESTWSGTRSFGDPPACQDVPYEGTEETHGRFIFGPVGDSGTGWFESEFSILERMTFIVPTACLDALAEDGPDEACVSIEDGFASYFPTSCAVESSGCACEVRNYLPWADRGRWWHDGEGRLAGDISVSGPTGAAVVRADFCATEATLDIVFGVIGGSETVRWVLSPAP